MAAREPSNRGCFHLIAGVRQSVQVPNSMMSISFFRSCIVYLKIFGGETSKNVQDVRKLVFRCSSVS